MLAAGVALAPIVIPPLAFRIWLSHVIPE